MSPFQRIFLLFFLTFSFSHASFILHNEGILAEKAVPKIEEMTGELHRKTGIGVYLSLIDSLKGETITQYETRLAKELKAPFVLISFARAEQQIDLVTSSDLEGKLDGDEVLDDYIIPLLVEKRKDLTYTQQYSAGLFNGVAFVTDSLAEQAGMVLESSVGSGSKDFMDVLMAIIKVMLALTIIAYFVAYFRHKKAVREGVEQEKAENE